MILFSYLHVNGGADSKLGMVISFPRTICVSVLRKADKEILVEVSCMYKFALTSGVAELHHITPYTMNNNI